MGRRVLGAICGLFFGVFLAVDLVMFGVVRFESALVLLFPIIGLAVGIGLVAWSPFRQPANQQGQVDSALITSDGA